jgi:hypothetical protein
VATQAAQLQRSLHGLQYQFRLHHQAERIQAQGKGDGIHHHFFQLIQLFAGLNQLYPHPLVSEVSKPL